MDAAQQRVDEFIGPFVTARRLPGERCDDREQIGAAVHRFARLDGEIGVGHAQFFGSLADEFFQLGQRRVMGGGFRLELLVGFGQLRGRGQRSQCRDQPEQDHCSGRRHEPGRQLQRSDPGIDRIPQRDDAHQVREAAQQDEACEEHHQPGKRNVLALAQHRQQREGNGGIGQEDQQVAAGPQCHQPGLPQQAHAMRHILPDFDEVLHVCSTSGNLW